MSSNIEYAYLIGGLLYMAVWAVLFIHRKDLRKKMLIMSVLVAPFGFFEFLFIRDYWKPPLFNGWSVGLEDFLFSFAIGGIAAVIYEELFAKRQMKRHLKKHIFWAFFITLCGIVWMYVGSVILGYNSIYVCSSILLVAGLVILFVRHDLIKDALYSGVLVGSLMFLLYLVLFSMFSGIVEHIWMLENISGILVMGIPIEELMWGFSWGFVAGPAYEFAQGLMLRKN